jgi:hypothetical protein
MPETESQVQHDAQLVPPGAAPHVDAIQVNGAEPIATSPVAMPASAGVTPSVGVTPLPVVEAPKPVPPGPVTWPVYAIPAGVTFGVSPNADGTSTLIITIADGTDELVSKAYTSLVKGLNAGWKSRLPVIVGARGGTRDNLTGQEVAPTAQPTRPVAPPAVPPQNSRRGAAPPMPQAQPQPILPQVPQAPPRPTNEGLSMSRLAAGNSHPRQPHASPSMQRLTAQQAATGADGRAPIAPIPASQNAVRAGHPSASMARRPLGPVPNQGQGGGEGQ